MPISSNRGNDLSASPIRSLVPYALQAKEAGKHIFHLNIGQPDIPTPKSALAFVQNQKDPIVKYGMSKGMPELRKVVSVYYDKFDANITSEEVYVTTGASEAILFALFACCDSGDEVILPEPFYANYIGFAQMSQVNIKPVTTLLKDQFKLPAPAEFEKLINPNTKAIFLCNPGNPTGQMYTADELEALMKIVEKHDLYLIVDEVYREFCYDHSFKSVLAFEDMAQHVIVIDSISKVFSACGARVGYLITKNRAIQETVNKYAQLRLCPPYFGQRLALACYDNTDHYIQKAKAEYIKRRDILYSGLSKIEGAKFYKPSAAFYNIVELPVEDAAKFCKWMLTDFSYENQTVMLAPANGFYRNKDLGKKQVRIAYILNEQDLSKALNCLKLGISEYNSIST